MVHVVDVFAFLALRDCVKADTYGEVLNCFTDLIREGEVTFPAEVATHVRRLSRGEPIDPWIKAAATDRIIHSVTYGHVQWVAGIVPELVDPGTPNDSSTYVAAFARMLDKDGRYFHVVTDDVLKKPTRMPLAEACTAVGWHMESMREFITCVGQGAFLIP